MWSDTMNSGEITTVVNSHETTRDLDAARAKYRGEIIPKSSAGHHG